MKLKELVETNAKDLLKTFELIKYFEKKGFSKEEAKEKAEITAIKLKTAIDSTVQQLLKKKSLTKNKK